jgi:hypothetical protein
VEGLASATAERERPLRGQGVSRRPLPWAVTGTGSTEDLLCSSTLQTRERKRSGGVCIIRRRRRGELRPSSAMRRLRDSSASSSRRARTESGERVRVGDRVFGSLTRDLLIQRKWCSTVGFHLTVGDERRSTWRATGRKRTRPRSERPTVLAAQGSAHAEHAVGHTRPRARLKFSVIFLAEHCFNCFLPNFLSKFKIVFSIQIIPTKFV